MAKERKFGKELFRFIVTGLCCALLDYLVCLLFLYICQNINSIWANVISTLMGFLIGVTLNYIMSTFWVYQETTDKKKKESKTPLFIVEFVLLSFVALLLSEGVMILSQYLVGVITDGGMDITEASILDIFRPGLWQNATFWVYFLCFCIRTLVGLVWNYFTRKYILYKTNTKKVSEPDNSNIENEHQKE